MKKRCFLPFKEPRFICSDKFTAANVIVESNLKEKSPSLAVHYINCAYDEFESSHKFIITVFDYLARCKNIMHDQGFDMSKEYYLSPGINLVADLKRVISSNFYIVGQCNRSYVEPNASSDAPLFYFFLTGYDDAKQEFLIHGIDLSKQYISVKIKYDVFVKALFDTNIHSIPLVLWCFWYEANIDDVWSALISEFEDYVYSQNRKVNYGTAKYGFEAMRCLAEHFKETAYKENHINELYLKKLLAHKYYMRLRIECLAEHKIIDSQWITCAKEVEEISQQIWNEGLDFNAAQDFLLVESMVAHMSQMMMIEKQYLCKVLKELNYKNNVSS